MLCNTSKSKNNKYFPLDSPTKALFVHKRKQTQLITREKKVRNNATTRCWACDSIEPTTKNINRKMNIRQTVGVYILLARLITNKCINVTFVVLDMFEIVAETVFVSDAPKLVSFPLPANIRYIKHEKKINKHAL